MDISGLPEVTSLEDNDYLVIQSGELTGKILKSNLEFTQPVTPQIVTSINPPENPEIGLIWNELDIDNNLVQQWNYLGIGGTNKWASSVMEMQFNPINSSTSEFFSLNSNFDYFIKTIWGKYSSTFILPLGCSIARRIYASSRLNIFANIVANIAFAGEIPANTNKEFIFNRNLLVNTENINNEPSTTTKRAVIAHAGASSGTLPTSVNNYHVNIGLNYQLVRKDA